MLLKKANVSQYGRSPALVYVSRAYLVILLHLYQQTPTRRSFDESQLEKDLVGFLSLHQIGMNEIAYQSMLDEAISDDANADGGWSLFSNCRLEDEDEEGSKCSSNSSVMSDQNCAQAELEMDYF